MIKFLEFTADHGGEHTLSRKSKIFRINARLENNNVEDSQIINIETHHGSDGSVIYTIWYREDNHIQ